jgi:hypothetical protein
MDTLHLSNPPSSATQPKSDNTNLEDDHDPPWYNKVNNNNLECYDPLLDLTNVHHSHDKYMNHYHHTWEKK